MERFWKYNIDHAVFWAATVVFHMFTRAKLIATAGTGQFAAEIIIRNSLLAIVIYVNLLVLIPRFAQQKKVALYVLLLLADIAFYVAGKNAHDVYLYGYVMNIVEQRDFFRPSYYNFSIVLFYMAFSVALQLSKAWYFQRDLIRKIEVEKLNTELEYLKAQINPHFLFNSINTIYFQIDKQNALARDTLSTFSDMLRYQLYECNEKEIPIEKEIGYLKNYVELQRLRQDEHYTISFRCAEDVRGFTIAPLLLIPFVENAFKHVSHHAQGNEIRIELEKKDHALELSVFNTRDLKARHDTAHPGIGLRNVRRMLALLYPDRHGLVIDEKPESFEVRLRLDVD